MPYPAGLSEQQVPYWMVMQDACSHSIDEAETKKQDLAAQGLMVGPLPAGIQSSPPCTANVVGPGAYQNSTQARGKSDTLPFNSILEASTRVGNEVLQILATAYAWTYRGYRPGLDDRLGGREKTT